MMQKGVVILLIEPGGERNADGNAQPLAERSRGDFYARQFKPMWMSLKRRIEFAQQRDIFFRTESGKGEPKIQAGRFVPRRPNDAIPVRPVGILGIVIGDAKIERGGDIHNRQRAPGVSRTGGAQGGEIVAPHQVGLLFQFVDAVRMQYFAGD